MGNGQYLVYSPKSSNFEECIIVLGFGNIENVIFFEECIIVFQAPAQFSKNKDASNTIHYGKFWL